MSVSLSKVDHFLGLGGQIQSLTAWCTLTRVAGSKVWAPAARVGQVGRGGQSCCRGTGAPMERALGLRGSPGSFTGAGAWRRWPEMRREGMPQGGGGLTEAQETIWPRSPPLRDLSETHPGGIALLLRSPPRHMVGIQLIPCPQVLPLLSRRERPALSPLPPSRLQGRRRVLGREQTNRQVIRSASCNLPAQFHIISISPGPKRASRVQPRAGCV